MKTLLRNLLLPVALVLVLTAAAARAGTITMTATYYTVAENDQDENRLASGVFDNEVQANLGPNGLPVLNTTTFGCTSNCFSATPLPSDVISTGEITWWSPALNNGGAGGTSDVVETGSGTLTLPYDNGSFYPPNGTGGNDEDGFQAAVFSTTLLIPTTESISFNVGADDVAFVYLDGSVVCDLGGVHGDSPGSCTTPVVSAGDYSVELFYADLHNTGAALTFDVTTSGINSTPEPASLVLIATGLAVLGVAILLRRRLRTVSSV